MKIKEQVYQALSTSGDYVSGEFLAQQVHVSRTAIWKAIHSLQDEGHLIETKRKVGYKLVMKSLDYNVNSIREQLLKPIRSQILVLDTIDSTNRVAKELAEAKAPDWTLVVAKQQTAGKGRFERSFFSPHGGLYCSLIVRPHMDGSTIHLITMNAAVALCIAVKECLHIDLDIKWVNDLFYQGKKVAGILTEASIDVETKTFRYLVVGIGINLKLNQIPKELNSLIIDLGVDDSFDKNKLIASIINNFYLNLSKPPTVLANEYRSRSMLLNKEVYVHGSETPCGIVQTITDQGELVVLTQDHQQIVLNSGEVSFRSDK